MKDMDDQIAGGICLTVSLVLLCIFLYGLVTFLKKTLLDAGESTIRYSLQFSEIRVGWIFKYFSRELY